MKPAPSIRNPPSHMNRKASGVWEHVLKRYADEIYEPKTLREQWAKAKNHFVRICGLRGIEPYQKYSKAALRL